MTPLTFTPLQLYKAASWKQVAPLSVSFLELIKDSWHTENNDHLAGFLVGDLTKGEKG